MPRAFQYTGNTLGDHIHIIGLCLGERGFHVLLAAAVGRAGDTDLVGVHRQCASGVLRGVPGDPRRDCLHDRAAVGG